MASAENSIMPAVQATIFKQSMWAWFGSRLAVLQYLCQTAPVRSARPRTPINTLWSTHSHSKPLFSAYS